MELTTKVRLTITAVYDITNDPERLLEYYGVSTVPEAMDVDRQQFVDDFTTAIYVLEQAEDYEVTVEQV